MKTGANGIFVCIDIFYTSCSLTKFVLLSLRRVLDGGTGSLSVVSWLSIVFSRIGVTAVVDRDTSRALLVLAGDGDVKKLLLELVGQILEYLLLTLKKKE